MDSSPTLDELMLSAADLPTLTRAVPSPLSRSGRRRLTRAHLSLLERPEAAAQGHALLRQVCQELGAQLGAAVEAEARLLDAPAPGAGLSALGAFALLELAGLGPAAVLEVELPFLVALLERVAGGAGRWTPATRLTRIEEATFGYVLLVVLAAARQAGGMPARLGARLVGVTLERAQAQQLLQAHPAQVGVEVALRVGALVGSVRLHLPATALHPPLAELPVASEPGMDAAVQAAALSLRCLVGRSPVSLVELMRIDPGDVVTLEGTQRTGEGLLGPGRLLAPLFALVGAFTPDGFTLSGAHARAPRPEAAMPLSVAEKNELTELSPALPVEVEVELARVRLTVAELSRLRAGSVLPLHVHASEPVLLRVGDRAVARAELVDIEGEVGARVLALLP